MVKDSGTSSMLAMEILQSCTKQSIKTFSYHWSIKSGSVFRQVSNGTNQSHNRLSRCLIYLPIWILYTQLLLILIRPLFTRLWDILTPDPSKSWCHEIYRQVSNISRTLVGNKIVDHSDVVEASLVGAAPTTSSFSTYQASRDSAKTYARQYENLLSVRIWCDLY